MKAKKYILTLAGCFLAGVLSAQHVDTTGPAGSSVDSLRQQKELDAWIAPVRQQLDSVKKSWLDYEQHHFDTVSRQFDTSGLGRVRAANAALYKAERTRLNEFARLHPAYFISLKALDATLLPVPEDIRVTEKLFNALDRKVRETPAGLELQREIGGYLKVSIGQEAPEFSAPDTSGTVVRLSAYRGKYLLLDFWASWCGPCREENPNVIAAYKKFHDRNFEILSVSLDQPGKRTEWVKAIQTDRLCWPQVSDLKFWKSEIAKLYSIRSIPQNFLIDPKGKIVAANLRGDQLIQTLERLL